MYLVIDWALMKAIGSSYTTLSLSGRITVSLCGRIPNRELTVCCGIYNSELMWWYFYAFAYVVVFLTLSACGRISNSVLMWSYF